MMPLRDEVLEFWCEGDGPLSRRNDQWPKVIQVSPHMIRLADERYFRFVFPRLYVTAANGSAVYALEDVEPGTGVHIFRLVEGTPA